MTGMIDERFWKKEPLRPDPFPCPFCGHPISDTESDHPGYKTCDSCRTRLLRANCGACRRSSLLFVDATAPTVPRLPPGTLRCQTCGFEFQRDGTPGPNLERYAAAYDRNLERLAADNSQRRPAGARQSQQRQSVTSGSGAPTAGVEAIKQGCAATFAIWILLPIVLVLLLLLVAAAMNLFDK